MPFRFSTSDDLFRSTRYLNIFHRYPTHLHNLIAGRSSTLQLLHDPTKLTISTRHLATAHKTTHSHTETATHSLLLTTSYTPLTCRDMNELKFVVETGDVQSSRPVSKKPKRTRRACLPCQGRKVSINEIPNIAEIDFSPSPANTDPMQWRTAVRNVYRSQGAMRIQG